MNQHQSIIEVFERLEEIDQSEIELIEQCFKPINAKRKEHLIGREDAAGAFYFINKGLLRLYAYKEGEERTMFFFSENMIAGSIDSFITNRNDGFILESLEDCELLKVDRLDLNRMFAASHKLTRITLALTQHRFNYLLSFFKSFVLDSPEERYLRLISMHPELAVRVPQHMLASFLGITPVSLSRIRKRITSK
ncbi:MAG: Crp/Fnr family transcriptional regulator [Cyclobacteriaceae bacterium]